MASASIQPAAPLDERCRCGNLIAKISAEGVEILCRRRTVMNRHQDQRLKVSSPAERESLLIRCWMTHDAMWFFHCAQECGMDVANKINRAAVRSMAQIEIKRIKKAVGIDKVETFQQLTDLLHAVFDLMKADFMDFTWQISAEDTLHWDMVRCFAYEGVQKLGVADQYQCGIFERMEGWAEGLGLTFTVTPQVQGCMMHTEGRCFRDFRFHFGEKHATVREPGQTSTGQQTPRGRGVRS